MGSIISRTSLLGPDVWLSPHPAPDVLSSRSCSCAGNGDNFRVLPLNFASSSLRGFHRRGGDEPAHQKEVLDHMLHMYGFAFLRF